MSYTVPYQGKIALENGLENAVESLYTLEAALNLREEDSAPHL